ncbi:hypothetical protein ACP86_21855 [Marinobacter sp. CP1]|uniref:DegT/DnrJ/EryC1/StrS family aminotransferase n=1 Tax=unclassified Marinobacter TaxID=83889 RepID=UPI00069D5F4D|nr:MULTISPECIES: DegT/DnrJ/EryC1/StrS family aminotransferase [unclassified Marinobacter]AKV98550.1 hypothetical protein ACP86_21855 [Marinobacter sp. CP1]
MGIGKLRPVGSLVPELAKHPSPAQFPWSAYYETVYLNNGTAALALAARLCKSIWKPDSAAPQIILPAYGCPDLIAALIASDIEPVLVDVSPERPWMDLSLTEAAINESTVAILAVGFLGVPDRLSELQGIAAKAGLPLIEDSAQVMPPGSAGGSISDFCVLSFGRGKPVNLMGGGALLIRRDHLSASWPEVDELDRVDLKLGVGWRIRRQLFNALLKRYLYGVLERVPQLGIGKTVFKPLTQMYRITNLDELLSCGLKEYWARPLIDSRYTEVLQFLLERGWGFPLEDHYVGMSSANAGRPRSRRLLRFPLLAPSQSVRDRALDALNRSGIGASVFYGRGLPWIEGVRGIANVEEGRFQNASGFASRLLTLPTHQDVTSHDIGLIVNLLSRYG